MQSKGETLELLLTTHFPSSEISKETEVPAAALCAARSDWRLPARVITYTTV